jgi:hypothetical protein
MGKTRTSRTVHDAFADCPRLNSNGKNAKSTAGRTGRWAGRTVRKGPADRPPGPHGPSAWARADYPRAGRGQSARSTELHPVLFGSEENNGLSARGPRTVRLEAHFLKNFCQKSQILNKYKKPVDRLPQGPGLSAQHLKTDFS